MAQDVVYDFFKAMDIIIDERLEKVSFDRTIVCRIIDDSRCEDGVYVVSDNTSTFKAYSNDEPRYKKNTSVYVTIPQGDFNNDKLIIGKYMKDSPMTYTYKHPTDYYIDVTGNLVNIDGSNFGLIANGDLGVQVIWEADPDTLNIRGYEYDRMAIKADFKSLLKQFDTAGGNYGLVLNITYLDKNSQPKDITYFLDSDEMNGNPYDFEVYFSQEKLIDTSAFTSSEQIQSMILGFYQKQNFVDIDNKKIPHNFTDEFSNEVFPVDPNLFVDNIYIGFGYDVSNFKDETIMLSVRQSGKEIQNNTLLNHCDTLPEDYVEKYGEKASTDYLGCVKDYNYKRIKLTTVLWDPDKELYSTSYIPENAKLHIYHFNPLYETEDPIAGQYWEEIHTDIDEFEYVLDEKKQFEYFKAYLEYPNREYVEKLIEEDEELIELKRLLAETEDPTEIKRIQLDIDAREAEYRGSIKTIESKELKFENLNTVANEASIDKVDALKLICDAEGLKGVYNVYKDNDNFKLAKSSDGTKLRYIKPTFLSVSAEKETGPKSLGEKITWKVPKTNSMIKLPVDGDAGDYNNYELMIPQPTEETFKPCYKKETVEVTEGDKTYKEVKFTPINTYNKYSEYYEKNSYYDEVTEDDDFIYYTIKAKPVEVEDKTYYVLDETKCYFKYRIKESYTKNYTNNTITCTLVRDGKHYTSQVTMYFGTKHNNGTDYRLQLSFIDSSSYLLAGGKKTVEIKVFDADNNDLTPSLYGKKNIQLSWFSKAQIGEFVTYSAQDDIDYENYRFDLIADGSGNVPIDAFDGVRITDDSSPRIIDDGNVRVVEEAMNIDDATVDTGRTIETEDGNIRISEDGSIRIEEGTTKAIGEFVSKYGSYILQVTVKLSANNRVYNITSLFPVPVSATDDYEIYEGPTEVVYDANHANPGYYKGEIALRKKGGDIDESLMCKIQNFISLPKIFKETEEEIAHPVLQVDNMFTEGAKGGNVWFYTKGTDGKDYELWVQPIPAWADNWQSELLNSWDGKMLVDEDNNVILTAMIGAGKKDPTDNTFSGVLMGEIGKAKESTTSYEKGSGYGLYGYQKGQRSFQLDVNGTFILGRNGKGQLIMDGNNSTIQSQAYKTDKYGMMLDLDDGVLHTVSKDKKVEILIDPNGTFNKTGAYFSVKGKNQELFHVGKDKYFLQTDDFVTNKSGTKIDLVNGSIESNNFSIKASQGSNTITISSKDQTYPINVNNKFRVKWDGSLESTQGTIGGFNIGTKALTTGDGKFGGNGVYLGEDGVSLGPNVYFSSDGKNGSIGQFKFDADAFYTGDSSFGKAGLYLGAEGISVNSTFTVDKNGFLKATSGIIGNWTIYNGNDENKKGALTNGTTTLGQDGLISCGRINVGGLDYYSTSINSWSFDKTSIQYLLAGQQSTVVAGDKLNVTGTLKGQCYFDGAYHNDFRIEMCTGLHVANVHKVTMSHRKLSVLAAK